MPDKLDPKEGDVVRLIGLPDGRPQEGQYTVLQVIDKAALKVKDQKGVAMRIHKSRVCEILKTEAKAPLPPVEPQTPPAQAPKKEEKMTEKAAVETPAAPAVATAAKPVEEKKTKEEKKPKRIPFDIAKWVADNGNGVHLSQPVKFDSDKIKVTAHVCVDEAGGYYHIINTYKYPDGVISLGKNNKGGSKYPLKGHRLTFKKETKKEGTVKQTLEGSMTAQEVIAKYEKRGYKIQAAAPATQATA